MLTSDQARKKFDDMLEEIFDTTSMAGMLCMPNEIGFKEEGGGGIIDNDKMNIYQSFTAFWLIKMAKRQGVATKSDMSERVELCMSIIGMNDDKKTNKIVQTLFV